MWTALLRDYIDAVKPETIEHISENYSTSEIGLHHPHLSCGIVFRDQGQTDVYSGQSRIILDVDGYTLHAGNHIGFVAESIRFNPGTLDGFKLLNKSFNPKIFSDRAVLTPVHVEWGDHYVFGPNTTILDGQGAPCQVLNLVPISSLFGAEQIFLEDPDESDLHSVWSDGYRALEDWGCF